MAIDFSKLNAGGISLMANFGYYGDKPLDSRLVVPSLEGLATLIANEGAYEGMIAYVASEKKHYEVKTIDGVLSYRQFGLTETELNDIITDATTAAMEFKGATASLPASANKGDMYKVSASFEVAASMDAQGAGFTTKVGDSIVSDGTKWYIIPTGDDIEDTWRPVAGVANDATLTFAAGDKLDVAVASNGTVTYKHEAVVAPEDKGVKVDWVDVTADGEGLNGTYKVVFSEDYMKSEDFAYLVANAGKDNYGDGIDIPNSVWTHWESLDPEPEFGPSTVDGLLYDIASGTCVFTATTDSTNVYNLHWNANTNGGITVYKQETASRTYITGIETDGFGHITGYTTATENVEDTNTTYDFDCQVEHSNVYFTVKASDSDIPQQVCVDTFSKNEINDKVRDINEDIIKKLDANGWKSNRSGDGWEYDWSIYKDDYGQPINYTNSSELNKDYLQFFKGQTQLDGNYNSWYPQTRVDAEGITIQQEDTDPHWAATMTTKFTTDKIIHTVYPFDPEQSTETYTLSLPHTTDTLAVKGEVDAVKEYADDTFLRAQCTLEHEYHAANWGTCNGFSGLQFSYDNSKEEDNHGGGHPQCTVIGTYGLHIHDGSYETYTTYGEGSISRRTAIWDENGQFAGNDSVQITLPENSGTIALQADVDAKLDAGNWSIEENGAAIFTTDSYGNHIELRAAGIDLYSGDEFNVEKAFLSTRALSIHEGDNVTGYKAGKITNFTLDPENGPTEADLILPLESGTIALTSDIADYHKDYQSGTIMDINHNNATDPSFITGITIQNGHVTGATVQNLKEVLQSLTVVLDGGTLKIG